MEKKTEEFLVKTKKKAKEIDSKLSTKMLKKITKLLMVATVLCLGIFTYWNYDHNAGKPGAIEWTNKHGRDVQKRTLERWGG